MSELLMVVEAAYDVRGGTELAPRISAPEGKRGAIHVRIERPDGSTLEARAELVLAHVSGPRPPFAIVRVLGLGAADVPAGTRVVALEP